MGRLGPGIPSMALEKATLVVVDGTGKGLTKKKLKFQYNPEHYTLQKSAEWKAPDQGSAKSTPDPTFTKTNPATLTMDIFFDAFSELMGDVTEDVQTLMLWTKPSPEPNEHGLHQPPVLKFEWGSSHVLDGFQGFLKSVSAQYTMFRSNGTPIRATCSITLEEIPASDWPQNPTSGGKPGLQAHVLIEGETLHSVAWAEYGKASYWRGVAALNNIDDPLRVSPGTRLLLPSPRDAGRMS